MATNFQFNNTNNLGLEFTPMVRNIIFANVIMLVVCFLLGQIINVNLSNYLALHRINSPLLKPWQFITHMFLHGGSYTTDEPLGMNYANALKHLFYNMVFLYFFGTKLEKFWGAQKFLLFYLIVGLAGAISYLAFIHYEFNVVQTAINNYLQNPTWDQYNYLLSREIKLGPSTAPLYELLDAWKESPMEKSFSNQSIGMLEENYMAPMLRQSMLGASGAVFGIVGAFAYLFPSTKIHVFGFGIPAIWVALYFLFVEITNQFGFYNSGGIAHLAHVGGLVAGIILAFIWNKLDKKNFY
jgi:membrane associated rhomboid family serine protease